MLDHISCLGCVFPLQPKLDTFTWACPEACLLGCSRPCQADKNVSHYACQSGSSEAPQYPDFCDVSDPWPQDWTRHTEVRQLRIPPINPVLDFLRMAAILKPRGCHQEAPNQYNKHSCHSGNSQGFWSQKSERKTRCVFRSSTTELLLSHSSFIYH